MNLSHLVGVRSDHFFRNSSDHGAAHVNRVIVLGQYLVREAGGPPAVGLALWASTFLHDLERAHDGACVLHGEWAVERRLAEFVPLFLKHGVLREHFEALRDAVAWHARSAEAPRSHPHYWLISLLKDADALDRCRFSDLDPTRLRIPQSHRLIEFAETLWEETNHTRAREDFGLIWGTAANLQKCIAPGAAIRCDAIRTSPTLPSA